MSEPSRKPWRKRKYLLGLILGLPLAVGGGAAGFVAWHEARYARFAEVAGRHGVHYYIEWQGPESWALREYCYENGWWAFYKPRGFGVGCRPDGEVARCFPGGPPVKSMELYFLRNPDFDNAALAELVAALPTPESVGEWLWVSDCRVDADGLRVLSACPKLKGVVWVDPHVPEEEVERVRPALPFRVTTIRPETCDQIEWSPATADEAGR